MINFEVLKENMIKKGTTQKLILDSENVAITFNELHSLDVMAFSTSIWRTTVQVTLFGHFLLLRMPHLNFDVDKTLKEKCQFLDGKV